MIAANDNRSGSPGEVHFDHRQATSMSWTGLGLNSRTTFSGLSPSESSRSSFLPCRKSCVSSIASVLH
jgi:hypothetical protein